MCWVLHWVGGCYSTSLNDLFVSFPSTTGEDWCGSGALHWSIHGFYWWIHLCLSADSTNVPHVPGLQWAVHRQGSSRHQLCLCCLTHYQYPCVYLITISYIYLRFTFRCVWGVGRSLMIECQLIMWWVIRSFPPGRSIKLFLHPGSAPQPMNTSMVSAILSVGWCI